MADSFLAYQNPSATDKKLDSETLTVGANTVERERVQISGAAALEVAAVKNAAPTTEYGVVVRNIPSGDQQAIGNVAHDAVDAGNPVKIGGKAASSAPTAVAAADRVDAYFDLNGRQVVLLDTALPAGANAIGKLAANSGVDIGDVDVLSLPALPAGSNNIGDVDVLTVPAPLNLTGGGTEAAALRVTIANDSTGVLSVDDNGGSLTVDQVATVSSISAKLATDAVMDNLTALTPKFAVIAASSSGDNVIVTAVATKKIRVLNYVIVANAAVNAKWQSGATDISGLLYLAANGGVSSGFCPVGHFETAANTNLELNLSGAVAVGGHITYVEV